MSIASPHINTINTIIKLSPYSSLYAWKRIGYNYPYRSFGSSMALRSPSTIDTDSIFDGFSVPDVNSSADVIEAYDNYRVLINIPGMDKNDLNLTLNGCLSNI